MEPSIKPGSAGRSLGDALALMSVVLLPIRAPHLTRVRTFFELLIRKKSPEDHWGTDRGDY